VEVLDALHPEPRTPPPLVELVPCYRINLSDPIFMSIREDYAPDFDEWFRERCQRLHRDAYVVVAEKGHLAGLCILKDEDDSEYGLPPRRLKLCTLKVAEPYRGQRLGELLIKAALDNAIERHRRGLSVTVLDKHVELVGLLEDLGFEKLAVRTGRGELVLFRSLEPPPDAIERLEPFELNRRYGPRVLNPNVAMHVVPIRPHWEERLFPEGKLQLDLFGGSAACGNGLRKAYISGSLNRQVNRGDLALLYRSQDAQAVRFIAVVEDTFASADYLEVARFVGTRTVYTVEEIQDMTKNGTREVNAVLMRQARRIDPPWSLVTLQKQRVLSRAPQSIQKVWEEGAEWIRAQLNR
jgi:GNAT superfamily N-acetyltransferase